MSTPAPKSTPVFEMMHRHMEAKFGVKHAGEIIKTLKVQVPDWENVLCLVSKENILKHLTNEELTINGNVDWNKALENKLVNYKQIANTYALLLRELAPFRSGNNINIPVGDDRIPNDIEDVVMKRLAAKK